MTEDAQYQVVDTSWLQLASVVVFAEDQGWSFNGYSFQVFNEDLMVTEFMSFMDMQKSHNTETFLHNLDTDSWTFVSGDSCLYEYVQLSEVVKYVTKSTLQYHKRTKKFIAQKHLVKLYVAQP